ETCASGIATWPFIKLTSVAGDSALLLLAYTNSAVSMAIKRKEKTYTDAIQMRSLRTDQAAFRRSAAEAARGTGSRRFASNNTIKAARARTVTKKNRSLRTIGPIKAI